MRIDVVTVYHNDTNHDQHLELVRGIEKHHPEGGWRLLAMDNRQENRGFARACNDGAFSPEADSPIIAFLNPDAQIEGPFMGAVEAALADERTAITGCRFNKPDRELRIWGVRQWVCGAAMFVRRDWFERVKGFDLQFEWGWDDTDLCRRAESMNFKVSPIELPISHSSPDVDTPKDARYKQLHFDQGQRRYYSKWGR